MYVKQFGTHLFGCQHRQECVHHSFKTLSEDIEVIFNGVNSPCRVTDTRFLDKTGVSPGRYILAVGRFVKEKGRSFLQTGRIIIFMITVAGYYQFHAAVTQ